MIPIRIKEHWIIIRMPQKSECSWSKQLSISPWSLIKKSSTNSPRTRDFRFTLYSQDSLLQRNL